jgi:2-aminoadipate transaminase
VGWVIAPKAVIHQLTVLKQGTDLHTSTFTQQVVYEVAREGFLDEHIGRLRTAYRERRDAMLAALAAEMPPEVSWSEPAGGLFIWLKMPPDLESQALLQAALKQDVAIVPGDSFFAPDARTADSRRYMRLNFSCATPAQIQIGIRRLAQTVREQMPAHWEGVPA